MKAWYVREFNKAFPNGFYDWPCKVLNVEPNYVETEHSRFPTEFTEAAIQKLREQNPGKSLVGSRTYLPVIQKHYIDPKEAHIPRTLIFN